jgi:hypothetical protein
MSPVRYELRFYLSEDDIPYSHRREKPQILCTRAILIFVPHLFQT